MAWNNTEPAATSKIKDAPAVFLGNWEDLEDFMGVEHQSFSEASCGWHRPGQCSVVMIDGTAEIASLNDVPSALAYDVELGVFKYNDGTQWVTIGGSIQSGTRMLFYANVAPVGWTIDTTLNDKLAYIVAGSENDGLSGGTTTESGTWELSGIVSDGHGLTVDEIPPHRHTYLNEYDTTYKEYEVEHPRYTPYGHSTTYTSYTGGDPVVAHSHNISGTATWRPPSYCFIVCEKD